MGKGGSGSQSPCPDSVVLNDTNAKDMLSEYSSDKEAIKCFDTSQVTTMEYPFMKKFVKKFVNADISSWDVSSVTNMSGMFAYATKFNSDVSDWDVSSVKYMNYMFYEATEFTGVVPSMN